MLYSGVDEVGYGALAGPILAVACTLPINLPKRRLIEYWPMSSVMDSKVTTAPARERLRTELTAFLVEHDASVGIGIADVPYINTQGYSAAREKVLLDAALDATKTDGRRPVQLVVDGNVRIEGYPWEQRLEAKADGRFFIVAAASIIAKILRDDMMVELAKAHPVYGFAEHKGYGTKHHIDMLETFGLSPVHRTKPSKRALRNRAKKERPRPTAFRRTWRKPTRRGR